MATRSSKPVDPRKRLIGEHIGRLRLRVPGLTQELVAERLGITPGAYQHYESGRSLPNMADVPELATALQVGTCDLFPDGLRGEAPDPDDTGVVVDFTATAGQRVMQADPTAYGQELGQQLGADLIDTLRHMSPERGALLMDFLQWLEEREKAGER